MGKRYKTEQEMSLLADTPKVVDKTKTVRLDHTHYASIPFLPDGKPAPAVLTAEETALFLRLDGNGKALRSLKYWRDTGQLRGVRLGRRVRYRLCDVEAFLAAKVGAESSSIGQHSRRSLG